MARKEKLKEITVTTLPNGYSLTFDGMKQPNGYMYFTPDKLLEGFMLHIGLNMTDQLNTETMQDFIVAAMKWNDNEKNVKEIGRLTAQAKTAGNMRVAMAKRLIAERERFVKLVTAIGKLTNDFKGDKEKQDRLYTVIKNYAKTKTYTLKDLGITSDQITDYEQAQQTDETADDDD